MKSPVSFPRLLAALLAVLPFSSCQKEVSPLDDRPPGEASEKIRDIFEDLFRPMDGGIEYGGDAITGRNMWILWTGGSEQFWDRMARESYGLVDLLKMLDSRKRAQRFKEYGLINEPAFRAATKPDEFGLWLDERAAAEPEAIDPDLYGRSSGVMGFRLFTNPSFDAAARKAWDPRRYETDAPYAASPTLVRPYRVGVTCGACHIGFHPLNPPADPENPRWENLASAIGNQYLREGHVFAGGARAGGFLAEMLKVQPPGTSDTSRIVTDHLNNPTAINPIFQLSARLGTAQKEFMHPEYLLMPNQRREMEVPRLQIDASDTIGMPGAILRPYVNMGMFSQHTLELHNPLIGFTPQRPFSIKAARKHSAYWNSTEERLENINRFFESIAPMRLADAPGGPTYIDPARVPRGRKIFAQTCATCHSSKQPPEGVGGTDWFVREIEKPQFLEGNFFANERRYPVTEVQTNAARALATNHQRAHLWDVFSSETYKSLFSPGAVQIDNPVTGKKESFPIPEAGPGYYRPPSLISLWTSAPFLHQNSVGKYTGDPSVKGRLEAFHDAIEKLLWPEKRAGRESIWRTSAPSSVDVPVPAIPEPLRTLLMPHADADGWFRLGPLPAGTPINLIANLDPKMPPLPLSKLILNIKRLLADAQAQHLDDSALRALMEKEIEPVFFKASKCPDLIEDRGHTYGAELPDDDKRALIEFLKTI
jgi:hypothetical protein